MNPEHDPHEPAERQPAYAKRHDDEVFLAAVNAALADAALPPPDPAVDPDAHAIVYVVGVPRSGTTLLSQLIARHLDAGWIDNLTARLWRRPEVGIRLSRMLHERSDDAAIELHSTYGVTTGPRSPHEFGYFWRHWLHLDEAATHELTDAELRRVDDGGLRAALHAIVAAHGRSVMFKNVICGWHASFLTRLHARSLFVWIQREPADTVASILDARRRRFGRYDAWWSLKPATFPFPDLGADPVADVVRQHRDCHAAFARHLDRDDVAAMTVRYEDLCSDPGAELGRIVDAVAALGARAELRSPAPVPLTPSPPRTLPPEMADRLARFLGRSSGACATMTPDPPRPSQEHRRT